MSEAERKSGADRGHHQRARPRAGEEGAVNGQCRYVVRDAVGGTTCADRTSVSQSSG
jgi:hypothetical protein